MPVTVRFQVGENPAGNVVVNTSDTFNNWENSLRESLLLEIGFQVGRYEREGITWERNEEASIKAFEKFDIFPNCLVVVHVEPIPLIDPLIQIENLREEFTTRLDNLTEELEAVRRTNQNLQRNQTELLTRLIYVSNRSLLQRCCFPAYDFSCSSDTCIFHTTIAISVLIIVRDFPLCLITVKD